jgi:hypothetical protein
VHFVQPFKKSGGPSKIQLVLLISVIQFIYSPTEKATGMPTKVTENKRISKFVRLIRFAC